MKKTCLVLAFILTCVCAVRADLQMNYYGYDSSFNSGYTITGSDGGFFELYLQGHSRFLYHFAIWGEGSDVQVTDLGITAQQTHLFHIAGLDGSVFWSDADDLTQIEVFDLSNSLVGIYSNDLIPILRADAGGSYSISAGQSVMLDGSKSYLLHDHGWNPASSLQPLVAGYAEWKIDGIWVGDGVSELITFDYLVNTLGLSYGVHNIEFFADCIDNQHEGLSWEGRAYSTIEIVPEPATMLLFGIGGIALARKRRC